MSRHRLIKHTATPSTQTGFAITKADVVKAIQENKGLVKQLHKEEYKHILNQAENAAPYFANYGCYGTGEDAKYFVLEFYQFKDIRHAGDVLLFTVAKEFAFTVNKNKPVDQLNAADVTITYGKIESTFSFELYTDVVSSDTFDLNGRQLQLTRVDRCSPEQFALSIYKEEHNRVDV